MKIVATLIPLFLSLSVSAEGFESKSKIEEFTRTLIQLTGEGKTVEAIENLRPYLRIPESELEASIENYRLQESMFERRFGAVIGAELIMIEERGASLIQATFIQKFEKHPMVWRIVFYKPVEEWTISSYRTDDQVGLLF